MYLHLGQSVVVPHRDILGIFVARAEAVGRAVLVCDDLPRSFVLVGGQGEKPTVYISQLSSATLLSRAERNSFE